MNQQTYRLGDVLTFGESGLEDTGYLWIGAGYAVVGGRVLLVLHNGFNKWVPPGGHLEPGETLAATAEREFAEETGLHCRVISATPTLHPQDSNATPDATPFYVDIEREGFRKPAVVHFFYIEILEAPRDFGAYEVKELDGMGLFSSRELATLDTFNQVRSIATYAIRSHPAPS